MEVNGKESAAALKAKSRKTVILPEAQVPFVIRKLTPRDFISAIEIVRQLDIPQRSTLDGPDERPEVIAERRKRVQETLAASEDVRRAYTTVLVTRGILTPKVLLDEDAVAGEGEVNGFDIPRADFKWLIEQVVEFSGLGTEAQAVEFFLGKAAANDGVSGPDGGAVREATA